MRSRGWWRHNPLLVLVVVVAVLVCMLFMPGMVVFAIAGAAAAVLLLPRLRSQAFRARFVEEPRRHAVQQVRVGPAGPGPPLLTPLRL